MRNLIFFMHTSLDGFVYVMGMKDKTYLAQTFGKKLGKAGVTGYCIKFKTLKDINIDILEEAVRHGLEASH